jgi:hypothetical protein
MTVPDASAPPADTAAGPHRPQVNRTRDAADLLKHIAKEEQEHFYVLGLDNKHRVLTQRCVAMGTVNAVTVAAREVATFGEDLDAAQVAANKRLAARLGIPFCEVCLRKKKLARARAEKAAVERATFPANLDAARSAESKKLAARLGIPFCEICVKKAFEREKGGGAR